MVLVLSFIIYVGIYFIYTKNRNRLFLNSRAIN